MKLRRTTLFVPGTLDKDAARDVIRTCGADHIVLDLEDTVIPSRKAAARKDIVSLLNEDIWGRAAKGVRVNAVSTEYCEGDIQEIVSGAGAALDTLIISKPESVDEIRWLDEAVASSLPKGTTHSIGYLLGIESARALTDIDALATASPNVEAIGFAIGDLSVSLHVNIGAYINNRSTYPGDLFHFHRSRIILAARTHGLWAMDGPWPVINDHATLTQDTRWGAMLGFDGKLVLAAEQVRIVHEALRPSEQELAYARNVLAKMAKLEQAGSGAGVSDGEFLDPVVIEPAKRIIARHEAPL